MATLTLSGCSGGGGGGGGGSSIASTPSPTSSSFWSVTQDSSTTTISTDSSVGVARINIDGEVTYKSKYKLKMSDSTSEFTFKVKGKLLQASLTDYVSMYLYYTSTDYLMVWFEHCSGAICMKVYTARTGYTSSSWRGNASTIDTFNYDEQREYIVVRESGGLNLYIKGDGGNTLLFDLVQPGVSAQAFYLENNPSVQINAKGAAPSSYFNLLTFSSTFNYVE